MFWDFNPGLHMSWQLGAPALGHGHSLVKPLKQRIHRFQSLLSLSSHSLSTRASVTLHTQGFAEGNKPSP